MNMLFESGNVFGPCTSSFWTFLLRFESCQLHRNFNDFESRVESVKYSYVLQGQQLCNKVWPTPPVRGADYRRAAIGQARSLVRRVPAR
jgi:hypothetical protein